MLKPCPFCGSKNIILLNKKIFMACLESQPDLAPAMSIQCKDCDAILWDFSDNNKNYEKRSQLLILKWNNRANIND